MTKKKRQGGSTDDLWQAEYRVYQLHKDYQELVRLINKGDRRG